MSCGSRIRSVIALSAKVATMEITSGKLWSGRQMGVSSDQLVLRPLDNGVYRQYYECNILCSSKPSRMNACFELSNATSVHGAGASVGGRTSYPKSVKRASFCPLTDCRRANTLRGLAISHGTDFPSTGTLAALAISRLYFSATNNFDFLLIVGWNDRRGGTTAAVDNSITPTVVLSILYMRLIESHSLFRGRTTRRVTSASSLPLCTMAAQICPSSKEVC